MMKLKHIYKTAYQKLRKLNFQLLSDHFEISGSPISIQPIIYSGAGKVRFGENVKLGYCPSPFFYNGVIHIEARNKDAIIEFGNNVFVNNNFTIICDRSKIEIGNDVLIGTNVEIIDSDFHEVHPSKRNSGNHKCKPVKIENNVFLGSNVKILKGVTIGENSIVSNGSIVMSSMPKNVIIAGNPASVIRTIEL